MPTDCGTIRLKGQFDPDKVQATGCAMPSEATVGKQVSAEVTVENTNDQPAAIRVTVEAGNTIVGSRSTTVDARSTRTVNVPTTFETAGQFPSVTARVGDANPASLGTSAAALADDIQSELALATGVPKDLVPIAAGIGGVGVGVTLEQTLDVL